MGIFYALAIAFGLGAVWLAWEMCRAPLLPADPTKFTVCPKCRRGVELGQTPRSTPDAYGLLSCHWCGMRIRIDPN